jgi:hypothetical protein
VFSTILKECSRLADAGNLRQARDLFRQYIAAHPIQGENRPSGAASLRLGILVSGDESNVGFRDGRLVVRDGHSEIAHHIRGSDIAGAIVFVTPAGAAALAPVLADRFDLLFNAIADPDRFERDLDVVAALQDTCPHPVLNRAEAVRRSARDRIATQVLTAGWILPECQRLGTGRPEVGFPLLARPVGSQTGRGLEMIADRAEFDRYRAAASGDIYVTRFVECAQDDGRYRKYRCYSVGGRIVRNQLIIGDTWNVHGADRFKEMHRTPSMKEEERRFLDKSELIEGARFATVEAMFRSLGEFLGLDYFAADFSVTPAGDVVLFEANACMRSYGPEWHRDFPYYEAQTGLLGRAFRDMIARSAGHGAVRGRIGARTSDAGTT